MNAQLTEAREYAMLCQVWAEEHAREYGTNEKWKYNAQWASNRAAKAWAAYDSMKAA